MDELKMSDFSISVPAAEAVKPIVAVMNTLVCDL